MRNRTIDLGQNYKPGIPRTEERGRGGIDNMFVGNTFEGEVLSMSRTGRPVTRVRIGLPVVLLYCPELCPESCKYHGRLESGKINRSDCQPQIGDHVQYQLTKRNDTYCLGRLLKLE